MNVANHLSSCGPHKLAKAFEFCLGSDSRSRSNLNSFSSPLPPWSGADSPHQSLFVNSPPDWVGTPLRSPRPSGEQLDSYFPQTLSKTPSRSAVPATPAILTITPQETTMIQPQKPMLLLVDDNAVNLRVNALQSIV
jgi:hypothetical protein